jgi:hypothetical protein
MPATVEVVILAHEKRGALEELVDNVRFFVPEADVVVFNGGMDRALTEGLGVDTCPYSRPMRRGNLVGFYEGVLRWANERRARPDFHVVLDSDQLFMRTGFRDFLEMAMSESEFMASGYLEPSPTYYALWNEVRRINYSWKWRWQSLYGLPHPSWGFNPGTVFRREFVDRVSHFANTPRILKLARRSRVYGIEEFVFSTLARRLGCNPIRHPGSLGLVSGYPSREIFERCFEDPDVFMIHKVGMEMDSPDRQIVRALRHGRQPDFGTLVRPAVEAGPRSPWKAHDREARARGRLKDLYFQVLP